MTEQVTKKSRKPMTTPTKAQLTAAVAYYEKELSAIIAVEALPTPYELQRILDNAPSLVAVVAAAAPVAETAEAE